MPVALFGETMIRANYAIKNPSVAPSSSTPIPAPQVAIDPKLG